MELIVGGSFFISLMPCFLYLSCKECPKHCTSCFDTNKCLLCESPYVLHGSQCISKCPAGTYKDHSLKQCLPCHPLCRSCSGGSADNCLSCKGKDRNDKFVDNRGDNKFKCDSGKWVSYSRQISKGQTILTLF